MRLADLGLFPSCLSLAALFSVMNSDDAEAQIQTLAVLRDEPVLVAESLEDDEPAAKLPTGLKFYGRVFVRDTMSKVSADQSAWTNTYGLDSARIAMTYKKRNLTTKVKLEAAGGRVEVRDAYVRLEFADAFRLQAGRFKRPMDFINLESKWDLPTTERGLLSTLRVGDAEARLPFLRVRDEGLSLRWRSKNDRRISATVAVFQNSLGLEDNDVPGSPAPASDVPLDLYARAELKVNRDLDIAAAAALMPYLGEQGVLGTYERGPVVSLEARYVRKKMSAWVTAFGGENMIGGFTGFLPSDGQFFAARAIVAPTLKRGAQPKRIQPFILGSFLDPTNALSGDTMMEIGAGVNANFYKDWRITLDYVNTQTLGDNAPILGGHQVVLQLGAFFSSGS